eukprot:TRINITY_DN18798_c0_g1_i1.p1 TRINITY_DN18798_c0_g1~~TRINITY_DN18798_c0_g1_i1.p1  ORF type:complete len:463 (+),score=98.28 TRINITY_DN18798_c0_g1_i1:144-1532(+)
MYDLLRKHTKRFEALEGEEYGIFSRNCWLGLSRQSGGLGAGGGRARKAQVLRGATLTAEAPPTWSDLQGRLPEEPSKKPLLTLYRDTNGWCPFCERVWIALREKDIPYDEVLINLYDKPKWYKEMVPTNLVPAVKFVDGGDVVWESEEILRHLDSKFPETTQLFQDAEAVQAAAGLASQVMNASMGLAYRTGNFSEESLESRRSKLLAAIDNLDAHLKAGGPFLLGDRFSAADLMAVPMLERYGIQLPYFAAEVQLRDPARWPALAKWFAAMDARPAYSERVVGDEYSWVAVAPVLMRIFGGKNGTLEGDAAERASKAEAAAQSMLEALGGQTDAILASTSMVARAEAARNLWSNRAAVIADATSPEPKSQKDLVRLDASKTETVDAVLRASAAVLLGESDSAVVVPPVDAEGQPVQPEDVAAACRYLAARLCAPRDMSAPAATALRAVWLGMARAADAALD